jgi:hypothetical protein
MNVKKIILEQILSEGRLEDAKSFVTNPTKKVKEYLSGFKN